MHSSPFDVEWQNNYLLVHTSGKSHTEEPVNDDRFALSIPQCIRLIRRVEML
jgi:hypothetical protein